MGSNKVLRIKEYQRRKARPGVTGIGLCAIFSRQGDWAFDFALSLARSHKAKLNIFHFLESPYTLRRDVVFVDAEKTQTARVTPEFIAQKDKQLRELFEERLDDYLDVGFRLCEGNDEWELRKCFRKGQYDVLVVGYNEKGASFGGTTTIEAFAARFPGPVVLVGPDAPDCFYVNDAAAERAQELGVPEGKWYPLESSLAEP